MIYDGEFINGILVKAIESCSGDAVTLAEMDIFLDRYFSELTNNLCISTDDLDTIIWHFTSKIKRIAQSNVKLTPKVRAAKSKQNDKSSAEEEMTTEDADYCTKLAIDAAISLVTFCPHLIADNHYKSLVSNVVCELLSINEQRVDGLVSLPGRPYVNEKTRESLLLLLQSLTMMTKYSEQNPLKIALCIFDKFSCWEKSANIKKTCHLSTQVLMTMCRSTNNNSVSSSCDSNMMLNPMPSKALSPILEEPSSPHHSSPMGTCVASSSGPPLIEFEEEEKRAQEEEENEKEKTEAIANARENPVLGDVDNLVDRSIQVDGVVGLTKASRSLSASSFYLTAVDLTGASDDATIVNDTNSGTDQTEMDLTIPSSPTLNKTHNQTTVQVENMSLEKSAFHHTFFLEENKCPRNDDGDGDDVMMVNSLSLERDTYTSPAKRLKKDNDTKASENIHLNEGDTLTGSLLSRSTYTLLPTESSLTSQPKPSLLDDVIVETVEDILKTANLDE